MDFLRAIFSSGGFMPHGHCYLWNQGVLWLHTVSDATTTLAYFSIPVVLLILVGKRRDLAFSSMFLWFALFIVSCGLTHLLDIVIIWKPIYWLQGIVKAITGISSAITAFLLVKIIPRVLAMPNSKELNKLNSDLQLANKELEAFSYSVSHDLRAPLRAIEGFSKLVVNRNTGKLDEDSTRMLGIVVAETKRMNQLIEDLLGFSRIIRKSMTCTEVDMTALAREAYEELVTHTGELEPKRQIEFQLGSLPKAFGEPGMLRQVWVNLLSNALKFTRPRPTAHIEVSAQENGEEIIYRVADNGVGFDMTYAEKLFGVFQRLHTQQEFDGTGVGLALVQRILQRHGGRIWAEATLDKGATFYFTLPKAR